MGMMCVTLGMTAFPSDDCSGSTLHDYDTRAINFGITRSQGCSARG